MKKTAFALLTIGTVLSAAMAPAQTSAPQNSSSQSLASPNPPASLGLDPQLLDKPATDAWPTYSGDYSGQRFSTLTQINQGNVKNLSLAWVNHLAAGPGATGSFVRTGLGNPP